MQSFKEFISEAFDSSFPYKWTHIPDDDTTGFIGEFKTDSSTIKFEMQNEDAPDVFEVSFGKISQGKMNNYSMTGEGEGLKVMSTVLKMIYDALEKSKKIEGVNISEITFSAEKDQGKGDEKVKTGRAKLYNRMAQKFASKIGKLSINDEERSTYFKITVDK